MFKEGDKVIYHCDHNHLPSNPEVWHGTPFEVINCRGNITYVRALRRITGYFSKGESFDLMTRKLTLVDDYDL